MNGKEPISKIKVITNSIKAFFESGSIHGLSNLERATQPIIKIIWIIIIFVSACYCIYSINESVNAYFEYESVTKSYTTNHLPGIIPHPAISFCNLDQSLSIEDMFLKGCYNNASLNLLDFHKIPINTIYGFSNCYSLNFGKDANGNKKSIEKVYYDYFRLDIFLGNSDTTNRSTFGLLVFIHDQKHYPFYDTGFTVTGGNC